MVKKGASHVKRNRLTLIFIRFNFTLFIIFTPYEDKVTQRIADVIETECKYLYNQSELF